MARIPRRIARGNNSAVMAYTGPLGETILNTTTGRLHAQDGVTAGGRAHRLVNDPSTPLYVRDFGVVGDGAANDTAALQLAFDTASITGQTLDFGKRMTCLVDNLVIKDTETPGWDRSRPILRVNGRLSTIRKRNSADNRYLVAPERWVTDVLYPQTPIELTDICLDAADIADYALVDTYYFAKFRNVECCRAVLDGLYGATHAANGTLMLSGVVENHYLGMMFRNNGRHGIHIDEGVPRTDWFLHDCVIVDNGPLYANLKNCAGASIKNNHGYNTTAGGEVNGGVYIGASFGATIAGNIFEGDALDPAKTCVRLVGSAPSLTLSHNSFYNGRVKCEFSVGCESIILIGNNFTDGAVLSHEYNDASRIILSIGNTFQSGAPYLFSTGPSHAGRIIASLDRSVGVDRVFDGEIFPGSYPDVPRAGVTAVSPATTLNMTDSWREVVVVAAALTGACAINLLSGASYGRKVRIVRPVYATGAYTISVRWLSSGIKDLTAAGQWADFEFDGGNWLVTGAGSL